jgi:hypothetical protein
MGVKSWLQQSTGWQRIWVIVIAISLLLHVMIWFILLPERSYYREREASLKAAILRHQKYLTENSADCARAQESIRKAEATYEERREATRKRISAEILAIVKQQQAVEAQLDEAEKRFDSLKSLQLQNRKSYLERRRNELREEFERHPKFDITSSVPASERSRVKNCLSARLDKDEAENELSGVTKRLMEMPRTTFWVTVGTATSWLVSSAAIYLVGWLFGWVYRGFRKGS